MELPPVILGGGVIIVGVLLSAVIGFVIDGALSVLFGGD